MAYGMTGHLGISRQQSFGTATTSYEFLPIISESLTTNIEQLVEEGMRGRYEEGPSQEGLLTVAGDIVFEPHPVMVGHFLRGVMGQASGSLVTSAYSWAFAPGTTDFDDKTALPPYTLEVYRDNGLAWQFTDAVVNALNFEITGGTIMKATASVLARVSSLATKSAPSYPAGNPYLWSAASFSVAGAAFSDLEECTLTIENNIEGVTFLDNTKRHGKYKRTGYRNFAFSGTMDFATQSQYSVFRSSAEQAMVLTFTGDAIGASFNTLKFDMPSVRYETFPVAMGGPGRITIGFDGKAKYNTGSAQAINVTLVNTRGSY